MPPATGSPSSCARATRSGGRAEDADAIFTAGNARPLDQALQHAPTELGRWLARGWGLDTVAASTLRGQGVASAVGHGFDPAHPRVCKLPQRVLGHLGDRAAT